MSHWKECKVSLKCSLNVLHRALLNIRKEWAAGIEVDEGGGLEGKSNYEPPRQGFNLVIRMGAGGVSGGVSGADIGFKRKDDGTWDIHYDYMPQGISNFEGAIGQSIAIMKLRATAQLKKYPVAMDGMEGNNRVFGHFTPIEDLA